MSAPRAGKGRAAKRPADLARERRIRAHLAELGALLDTGKVDRERTRAMLAGELEAPGMTDDDTADVGTSIRLPRELLDRAERIAESRGDSRSATLRRALERGLLVVEREAAELEAATTRAELLAELARLRARVAALDGGDGE